MAAACGSGAPAATPGRTVAPVPTAAGPATVQPGGAVPDADALCAAVSPELATVALGKPADVAQSGDVLPRPNGVYCHYSATGDANTNVEAQLKAMSQDEFESLAETLNATSSVSGVGEAALGRDGSSMGGEGATIVAWDGDRGVTVLLNREGGDQTAMNAAVKAIAIAALASN
jgi:hypothetical protein